MKETSTTRRDCFAYDEKRCRALNERYCDREDCKFFKTKEEFEAGFSEEQMKAYTVLKSASVIFIKSFPGGFAAALGSIISSSIFQAHHLPFRKTNLHSQI